MHLRIISFAAIFSTILVLPASLPTPTHASAELMQCMIDCIKKEGESKKNICKTSCAGTPVNTDTQNHDCMGIYKECKAVCGNDKNCKKVCKDALMNCV